MAQGWGFGCGPISTLLSRLGRLPECPPLSLLQSPHPAELVGMVLHMHTHALEKPVHVLLHRPVPLAASKEQLCIQCLKYRCVLCHCKQWLAIHREVVPLGFGNFFFENNVATSGIKHLSKIRYYCQPKSSAPLHIYNWYENF